MNEGNHLLQQLRQKKRILNPKGGRLINKFNLQGKEKERKLKNSNSLVKWYAPALLTPRRNSFTAGPTSKKDA